MVSISIARTNDCFGHSTLRKARSQRHLYRKRCRMSHTPRGRKYNIRYFLPTLLPKYFSAASVLRSLYSEHNSPFWRNLSHANGSWLTPPSQSGLGFSVQLPPLHSGSWKKIFTFQIQTKWRPHSSGNMAGAQRGTPMILTPISGMWCLSPDLPCQWALGERAATAVTASLQMSP